MSGLRRARLALATRRAKEGHQADAHGRILRDERDQDLELLGGIFDTTANVSAANAIAKHTCCWRTQPYAASPPAIARTAMPARTRGSAGDVASGTCGNE
jgi:hypothetical protein